MVPSVAKNAYFSRQDRTLRQENSPATIELLVLTYSP